MAGLPDKKISKIKVDSSNTYDIVPSILQDGSTNNKLSVPTLTEDSTIALTSDIKNGTLTIQKNGTNVQTFTANQSSNVTANITVPTTLDDISDGSTRKLSNYLPIYQPEFISLTPQGGGQVLPFAIRTSANSVIRLLVDGSAGIHIGNIYGGDQNVHIYYDDESTGQATFNTDLGNGTYYSARLPRLDGEIVLDSTVSKHQSSSVVVGNATTNINGRVFQNYTATLVTSGGYTFYQILKNGNNPTEDEAKEYMKYMTGSEFLPEYNYDFPKQTIFTFADRSTWKPQYSSSDGLRLYRLTTSLALASDIPTVLSTGASNKDKYLHTNASTGALEWSTVSFTDTNYYATSNFNSTNGTKIATGYSSGTASTTYDLYAPNATTSQAGLVTTGAQTFGGLKSFHNGIAFHGGYGPYWTATTEHDGELNLSINDSGSQGEIHLFNSSSSSNKRTILWFNNTDTALITPSSYLKFPINKGTTSSYAIIATTDDVPTNIQNGSGTGAVQEIQDGTGGTFDFTNKNPNATALDSSLTGNIAFGGIGNYAASFGGKSQASGKRSVAQGTTTVAKGNYSHAEGDNSVSLGADSHAEGYQTVSYGGASHAEGTSTQALGNNSHAEGNSTIARAVNSHAEGYNSQTLISDSTRPNIPAYSDQQGGGGSSPGQGGTSTAQTGDGAHVEGSNTRAVGNYSHAEGTNTWAGGLSSHAEGYGSQALYDYAHAEGYNSVASGYGAHATGLHTVAAGNYSFTQGQQTEASYNLSSAFGKGTQTHFEAETVIGKYNSQYYKIGGTPLFTVGNGTANNARSNAFVVYADGSAEVSGKTVATTHDLTGFVTGPSSATDNGIALFDGTTGKLIKSTSNITIDNGNISILPALSSTGQLGNATKKWGSIDTQNITVYNKINQNSSYKGLVVPTTTSWTADKTIATTDDIDSKDMYVVHKGTSSSSVAEDIYGAKTFWSPVIFAGAGLSNIGSLGYDGGSNIKLSASGPNLLIESAGGTISIGNSSNSRLSLNQLAASSRSSSAYTFTDKYKATNSATVYTSTYTFSTKQADGSYTIATTDDIPDESNLVHKAGDTMTGSLALNIGSGYSSSPNLTFVTSTGAGNLYKSDETLYFAHTGVHSYTLTFPMNSGTVATTNQLPQILDLR